MAFKKSQPCASLPTLSPTGVAQPNASHSNASQEPEPSLSQPTALEDHELQPKENLLVLISGEGEAIGPNAANFSSRAGHYIKAKIPVFYLDWKTVKQTFKDVVRNKLMNCAQLVWSDFVIREDDPTFKAMCKQNSVNRLKNPSKHCLGRQSYARKLYLLDEANPEIRHTNTLMGLCWRVSKNNINK
ncbi:hypothetical protein FRX31_010782 [Thalictrum thalictroides]|uniref:Uncharacterized protein n=1 Tax=Thalictrum thalictroides TaxID=46969 RepID=A0A7J6WQI6_THATH|nr:hypothetical protein FRX31_010782 [Thalictrum thalictroides]